MKIKITKENLLIGIQTTQNIVSNKITLPILSNILLETNKKDKLKINATDLDIGISCEIPVEILLEGAITVPAKKFSDIIRELPSGDIFISAKKNNQVEIEGSNFRFKINGLAKDEFPNFPEFKENEVIDIDQKILKEMFKLTSFAVSMDETRYVLNGVLMEISDDIIRMVATDGRRLAKIEKKQPHSINKELNIILPLKAVNEILRNLKDEGTVKFILGTNQVLFDINGTLIATRIIEGEFPNYSQVIPKPNEKKVKVKRMDLLAGIKRANLLSTPNFVAVKFEVFKDRIVILKTTPDVGESREEVLVEYGGAELMVGFNPQLFIDFLKSIEEEIIEIEFNGSKDPIIIRLKDYLYLIVPMTIA